MVLPAFFMILLLCSERGLFSISPGVLDPEAFSFLTRRVDKDRTCEQTAQGRALYAVVFDGRAFINFSHLATPMEGRFDKCK